MHFVSHRSTVHDVVVVIINDRFLISYF